MTLSLSSLFRESGASFLMGIVLSHLGLSLEISFVLWLSVCVLVLNNQKLSQVGFKKKILVCFFIFLSFLMGFWRESSFSDKLNKSAIKNTQEIEIEAMIVAEPVLKDEYQRIIIPNVVIYAEKIPRFQFGDIIRIEGKIQPLEDFFSYSSNIVSGKLSYPKIELISSRKLSFRGLAITFKNKLIQCLQKVIPEPQSGLLSGIIFGSKQSLTDSLEKDIRKTGLSHFIVTSGLHLSIFVKILSDLLNAFSFGNFLNFICSNLFLLSFAFMAGLTPSIIRAAIMAFLLTLSHFSFRIYNSLNALLLAGLTMVWLKPFLLFYDLGFQLSFLATAGILLFYPIWDQGCFWQKSFFNNQAGQIFKQTILSCFAASFLVIPWLIFKTQNVSLVAPLVNVLVIPLAPLVLGGGVLTAILSLLIHPVGLFLGFWLNIILVYFVKVIAYFANLSWAEISLPYILRWLILPYYLLVFLYYRKKNQ
ncbi:MAG: ComEC/Rec2 family competence protein [Candidatus Pacebacteria bacterium]|nr:ComEC/Rec2 family competence protein [Candidatus Paceibacterota bacterium]MDD5722013.1 ComEC/Rec2 family competence protein [Candidatus Paceibacterota bacterium]